MSAMSYLDRKQLAELKRLDPWRGLGSVIWSWGIIFACLGLYVWRPGPLTFLIGFVIISGRHLALAILMHEAAHYLILPNRRRNDWIGQWLLAQPIMLDVFAYRQIHFQHHKETWTDADPDLGLAKPFPITRRSFARKVARDLTGLTGLKRYRMIARLSAGLSPFGHGLEGTPWWIALARFALRQKGFLSSNALLLAGLSVLGHPEAFFLLWWLPALTGYSLVLRLRSIAEHAAVSDPGDELKQTRTTLVPLWLGFFIAPHHVNYHLEHHLFMFIPHYRLPRAHRLLGEAGVLEQAEVAPSYLEVLRRATSLQSRA